jgi:hypothetical protein
VRLFLALLLAACGGAEPIVCENVCPSPEPAPQVSPGEWASCVCLRADGSATYYYGLIELPESCALRRQEWAALVANGCHG